MHPTSWANNASVPLAQGKKQKKGEEVTVAK
jgi:hypothetical protein